MAKIKGAIVVDTERCKQVNKKGYTFAHQVLEDTCNGCASCATVCPDGCITVYKVKQQ